MTSIDPENFTINGICESLFSLNDMAVYMLDRERRFIQISPIIEKLTGHGQDELRGMPIQSIVVPDNKETIDGLFKGEYGVCVKQEIRLVRKDSSECNCIIINMVSADGNNDYSVGVIKAKQPHDPKVESILKTFTMAVEQSPATVVITDRNGSIEYVNPKFTSLTGYSFNEAMGNNPRILKSGDQRPEFYKDLWTTISSGKEWRGDFHNSKKNGELYWESASISPIKNDEGDITHYVAVKEDITERKRAEEELRITGEKLKEKNSELEWQLMNAQAVTRLLLPEAPPRYERVLVDFRFKPLEAIGGDFFSFNTLHEHGLGVFIGDVAGHGVSAALFLTLLRSITDRLNAGRGAEPSRYIKDLNGDLAGGGVLFFITALYGYFDFSMSGATFRFAKGGHTPPILYRSTDGSARMLASEGMPVGLSGAAQFQEITVDIQPGDRIYLYTDGIIETRNEQGGMIEVEGLRDSIIQSGSMTLEGSLDHIMREIERFRGPVPLQDDMVLIGFEIKN
ncbi:MAG: SpoIIE family protein phosphatase [Spirochaetes bacterium]|nr:SpoIIE family protein phosphatase [Spirochaetota bacterium]